MKNTTNMKNETTQIDPTDDDIQITEAHVRKLKSVIGKGLCAGLGVGTPGEMCVMAAIHYSLGGNGRSDEVHCVEENVQAFDISLNDSIWSSDKARGRGMRREAIAKLGSRHIDPERWAYLTVRNYIAAVVPYLLKNKFLGKVTPKEEKLLLGWGKARDLYKYYEKHLSLWTSWEWEGNPKLTGFVESLWHAIDDGFNTGSLLYDLYRVEAFNDEKRRKIRDRMLGILSDASCDALVSCKSEGSKFLYLLEKKK
jgi:hypothetical protein